MPIETIQTTIQGQTFLPNCRDTAKKQDFVITIEANDLQIAVSNSLDLHLGTL